jgi:hypothetical protein
MSDTSTTTGTEAADAAAAAAQAAEDAATQAAADAAAAGDTTTTTTEPSPWDDPTAAKAEIERLRRENAAARTNAKQTAAEEERQRILKLLSPESEAPTVESLSAAIQAKDQSLTAAEADAQAAKLELAVYKAAPGAKADAAALLDSNSFREAVKGIDPTDAEAITAAITAATTTNPRLKASQVAAVGGADIAGGSGTVRTYTRAQLADTAFYQANKTDILAALTEGRIRE